MTALCAYATEQWGMVTSAQAGRAGVSRLDMSRLVRDEVLAPVGGAARVYRLTGTPEGDLDLEGLRGAWLQLGGGLRWHERLVDADAVVSHRSAAGVRGLGDLIPRTHEFYVSRRRQPRRDDLTLRVRAGLVGVEWNVWEGIPVTTVRQTVADLLEDWEDESAVARICQDAVRDGLLGDEELVGIVAPYSGRYGHRSAAEMTSALLGVAA